MKFLRSSHKNSNSKKIKSIFHHFCLGLPVSHKLWKQEIAKIPDWPRRKSFAEFRLCIGHDCLGTYLHRIGIRPDPYCTLCSLGEPMDRDQLGKCTAQLNRTVSIYVCVCIYIYIYIFFFEKLPDPVLEDIQT